MDTPLFFIELKAGDVASSEHVITKFFSFSKKLQNF
jgi:hypothetical protein